MVVVVVVMYESYRNTPSCVGVQWSTLFLYTCSINSDTCSPGWSVVVVGGGWCQWCHQANCGDVGELIQSWFEAKLGWLRRVGRGEGEGGCSADLCKVLVFCSRVYLSRI